MFFLFFSFLNPIIHVHKLINSVTLEQCQDAKSADMSNVLSLCVWRCTVVIASQNLCVCVFLAHSNKKKRDDFNMRLYTLCCGHSAMY